MHESAFDKFIVFVETYLAPYRGERLAVLDVGSRAIADSATHRATIEANGWTYTGIDLEPGANVDLVVPDPTDWRELASDSYDVVLCSQVLEHAEQPWRVVDEISRVCRARGLIFLIAPSSGPVHRYPRDCFRYYPDGLPALAKFAGLDIVEAHAQERAVYDSNLWCDATLIAQKPLLSPEEGGRAHARHQLARLLRSADLGPSDLGNVDFSPGATEPSVIAHCVPGFALARREEELAVQGGWQKRVCEARRRLSGALKALRGK